MELRPSASSPFTDPTSFRRTDVEAHGVSPRDTAEAGRQPDSTAQMMTRMQEARLLSRRPGELQASLDGLFERARTSPNPVLRSVEPVVRNLQHVEIDLTRIRESAAQLTQKQVTPANWRFPVYIDEDSPKTIDFFMLENSINFMFFDPKSGEKYTTEFHGSAASGAEGMTACLKRALEEGIPILDADFLAHVTMDQMRHIFRGNMEMPLLNERMEIFHEVGAVLNEKYDGHFSNLARAANFRAFDGGNGMVERLVRDFPSFRDSSVDTASGQELVFNKRAQLAVGMLASRLAGSGLFDCPDVDQLTVFADYQLPRGLRTMGILRYAPELAEAVDTGTLIPRDSRMEQELRAATLVAAKLLEDEVNRRPGVHTDARGVDSLLWYSARQSRDSRHHMTVTTAY